MLARLPPPREIQKKNKFPWTLDNVSKRNVNRTGTVCPVAVSNVRQSPFRQIVHEPSTTTHGAPWIPGLISSLFPRSVPFSLNARRAEKVIRARWTRCGARAAAARMQMFPGNSAANRLRRREQVIGGGDGGRGTTTTTTTGGEGLLGVGARTRRREMGGGRPGESRQTCRREPEFSPRRQRRSKNYYYNNYPRTSARANSRGIRPLVVRPAHCVCRPEFIAAAFRFVYETHQRKYSLRRAP